MPLITCTDCGREHSDAAPACPQCGRPASARAQIPELSEMDIVDGWRESTIRCPHCGALTGIATRPTKLKRGLSGGKIVGGMLTLGVSILATGLSRKQAVTEAWCRVCSTTWHIE